MGIKRRRGRRAIKLPVGPPPGEPGGPEADPCTSIREFGIDVSPDLWPYITIGSPVSLHLEAGEVAVMIDTRTISILTDPAVPQLIACMNRGYEYAGIVTDVNSEALQAKIRVTGSRSTE